MAEKMTGKIEQLSSLDLFGHILDIMDSKAEEISVNKLLSFLRWRYRSTCLSICSIEEIKRDLREKKDIDATEEEIRAVLQGIFAKLKTRFVVRADGSIRLYSFLE